MNYISELGIMGNNDKREWEENSQFAATAHRLTQFSCDIALISGEDSAQPVAVDND
jgi:hypothetical protein